jgi:hypothetical protein
MARLRSLEYGTPWLGRAMAEPPPGDPKLNGRYRGPLPVQEVARGVPGADLTPRAPAPAAGQIWLRGGLRVEVVRVNGKAVSFLELGPPWNTRTLRRSDFLRTSRWRPAS